MALAGVAGWLMAYFVLAGEPRVLDVPVRFATAPPELAKEWKQDQGTLSDAAFLETRVSHNQVILERKVEPAVYTVLALSVGLLLLGGLETPLLAIGLNKGRGP
jgi:hypothetical protein